jgi:SWIM zinc finger
VTTPVTSCLRPGCGRRLRSAESVARGYSLRCWRLKSEREEALRNAAKGFYTDVQVDRAFALIDSGDFKGTKRAGVYRAKSSDGQTYYIATNDSCTCPAGQHDQICKHRVAAALEEAWKAVAA